METDNDDLKRMSAGSRSYQKDDIRNYFYANTHSFQFSNLLKKTFTSFLLNTPFPFSGSIYHNYNWWATIQLKLSPLWDDGSWGRDRERERERENLATPFFCETL